MKVYYNNYNLSYADFRNANLSRMDFSNKNLRKADLSYTNLYRANLSNADLNCADLSGVDLRDAILSGADLRDADLSYSNLSYSNLSDANLSDANLSYADLSGADLYRAILSNANLSYTNLTNTNLPLIPLACPEKGEFIGWKKAKYKSNYCLVKLFIPEDALRSSSTGKKCRCNKAKVLDILNLDKTPCLETKVHSLYDRNFIYTKGKTVEVKNFDTNRWNECSTGIHFFMDIEDAIKY